MRRSPDRFAGEAAPAPCIALAGDGNVDWHVRALKKAFAALGVRTMAVDLRNCHIDTEKASGLDIAGFHGGLPDGVFVRTVPGGTFQAVTLRLGILHALGQLGVTVWNDARAIERCVDKSATSFLLARAGILTPATWTTESRETACAIVRREHNRGPLVLKPLFGSQGRGLRLIRSEEDLPAPDDLAGVYYLQRFVGVDRDGFRDFRLLVSDGRVVAAMMRQSPTWITNVKRGGRPIAVVSDRQMGELAVRAAEAVGASFAGVDILQDAEGRPTVLEVNSMPAWSGLQSVTRANIASVLVGDFLSALPEAAYPRARA